MRVAIVGCGFVADMYVKSLALHPELELGGVADRDQEQAVRFSAFHGISLYRSFEALLADPAVDLILNLTNPRSHFDVSRACLEAGKHVYSEKPLAMDLGDAVELVALAERRGLLLSSAPCSLFSETAQTLWRAIRDERIGPIRLVYAEMDDGMVHRSQYRRWQSDSGAPWPYKDEFEVGCTLEHAGYCLTWLAAFFGPAETVSAFSSILVPDKNTDVPLDFDAPDFSVACIRFASGIVARLTCSVVGPHDHRMRFVGDRGVLSTNDSWFYRSPVYLQRMITIRRRTLLSPWKKRISLLGDGLPQPNYRGASRMDFCRGVADMAAAIREGREASLSARFSLHVTELALAIHNAGHQGAPYRPKTRFEPIAPMPWASRDTGS